MGASGHQRRGRGARASDDDAGPGGARNAETLAQFESVTLFVDRASLASADFRLSADNAQAVAELCVALDGVPLAVELAAARIETLSPQGMLRQLTDRYGLLDQGYRDAPDRHRSLRACLDWSFDLCSAPEQEMWCRMSVFAGGCDLADARAVCGGDGLDRRRHPDRRRLARGEVGRRGGPPDGRRRPLPADRLRRRVRPATAARDVASRDVATAPRPVVRGASRPASRPTGSATDKPSCCVGCDVSTAT